MSVKEFFVRLPYLCGSDDPEYYSEANAAYFDHEKANPDSAFKMREQDYKSPYGRIRIAFAFTQGNHNHEATDYCKKLGELVFMAHRQKSHGEIVFDSRIADLVIDLQELEPLYPEVSAVLSVKIAADDGGW